MTAVCHYGEGTTGIVNVNELEPISAHELPCPDRFPGSFEAARAEAFLKSKLLVVAIVSGRADASAGFGLFRPRARGKPVREEAMQYMALASQEVRVMLGENAVFWRGKPTELKDTQFRQLAPVDMLPSLAISVPLAADAMTVILAIPGAISRPLRMFTVEGTFNRQLEQAEIRSQPLAETLDSILEGLEAMEVHRQVMLARQNDEDVQLRQAQDQEYAEGLARDQAAAANAAAAAAVPQQEAVRPAPVQQGSEPVRQVADPADEARRALAEEFLREGPSPTKADPVRLVLKLPTGERVERTFESQDPLARVRRWATCLD
ncbi:unnamed protein product [Symbiodinium sp. CCMP2456]|nr:unnamed protein product [Symbiodinium sp. CCMP2456]